MKCPNCGYELPEGHLLCEKCGHEIKIVPDFEIDVENSISETLSTIVDEIIPPDDKDPEASLDTPNLSKEELLEEDFFKDPVIFRKEKPNKKHIALALIAAASLFAVILIAILFVYIHFSSGYQQKRAEKYMAKGQYDKAISCVDKGISLNNRNEELYLTKAKILYAKGDVEEAMDILDQSINNKKISSPEVLATFYEQYIDIYEKEGDYADINTLLLNSNDEYILNRFSDYISVAPVFSIPTGSYEKGTSLSLEFSGNGDVYYTTDGTDPSASHGTVYTGPISLEKGEYDIKAVFINKNGTVSDIAESYYLIDVVKPGEPIVNPESGSYTSPFNISAFSQNVNDKIYYTTDGSDPDEENGILYTEPFKAPIGKSNMSFVAVSEDGISSEIIRRSYDFDLKANMSGEEAYIYLLNDLYIAGKIADRAGTSKDGKGTYSYTYDSMVEISGSGYYYILVEYYSDGTLKKTLTGYMYAVDPYTGAAYYFLKDASGNMSLLPI
ncbi:MAG: chitobiase/beta-hexosaminidase C-terminal domain-containing protein [Lachnospiraceae bacterium]|nr:chitobiase/beta-hexosaminidase C-terminal domain-containing protein [Lachnospiraceae bacterium]